MTEPAKQQIDRDAYARLYDPGPSFVLNTGVGTRHARYTVPVSGHGSFLDEHYAAPFTLPRRVEMPVGLSWLDADQARFASEVVWNRPELRFVDPTELEEDEAKAITWGACSEIALRRWLEVETRESVRPSIEVALEGRR